MGVLVCHTLGGVEQQQHHVGRLDGLERFHHREFLDGLKHLTLAAQSCGVYQFKALTVALKRHSDGIAGRTWHVKCHQSLFTKPCVDEGGLAHIGTSRHGELDHALVQRCIRIVRLGQVERLQCNVHQTAYALPVGRGHGINLAQPQLVKLRQLDALEHALRFVRDKYAGLTQATQVVGNVVILRRDTRTGIHHKNHHVRLGDRLLGLLGHLAVDAAGGIGLKAPRIDDDVLVFSLLAVPVVSVTRKSRKVGDDGVARLGQAIEKRGLTDIRTPHEGDYWLH